MHDTIKKVRWILEKVWGCSFVPRGIKQIITYPILNYINDKYNDYQEFSNCRYDENKIYYYYSDFANFYLSTLHETRSNIDMNKHLTVYYGINNICMSFDISERVGIEVRVMVHPSVIEYSKYINGEKVNTHTYDDTNISEWYIKTIEKLLSHRMKQYVQLYLTHDLL